MTINLHLPESVILKPSITVFGVGGAGGNAVNNMISADLRDVRFVVANTDAQALEHSIAERKIQLGENITRGLGAGASPDIGKAAAEEAINEILDVLSGTHMVFITAGMGGGTGTGAAPVIAKMAREQGILTVGVVTKPFHFEGAHRMKLAESGLQELQKYVDTLIVIPNQNLFRIANEKTTFADAFKMADDVLHAGVRGVTDLITQPGLINLDFADIVTIMSKMGKAMMGTGEAGGDKRAIQAAEAAISNPLLDHCSMKGARGVLINITGGPDMTLFEVDEAANRIREEVDTDANIIFGSTFNPILEGKIRVSVVATGIDLPSPAKESINNILKKSSPNAALANEQKMRTFSSTESTIPAFRETATTASAQANANPFAQGIKPAASSDDAANAISNEGASGAGAHAFAEEMKIFVAPQPAEPKQAGEAAPVEAGSAKLAADYEQAMSGLAAAVRSAPKASLKAPEKEATAAPSKLGAFNFFGRVANSVRGRNQSANVSAKGHMVEEAEDQLQDADMDKENSLDIPAFLRRKSS